MTETSPPPVVPISPPPFLDHQAQNINGPITAAENEIKGIPIIHHRPGQMGN